MAQFRFPTLIKLEPGLWKTVADHLKEQGVKKPLVVTDQGLAQYQFFKDIVGEIKGKGLHPAVFSGAHGNPTKNQVVLGVQAYKEHQADSIVLVGGGCAIDVGKAIALLAHHPGDLFDYEDDKPGASPIDRDIPYMIALPTTAGTGSEVGGSSVIADDKTHKKLIIWSPRLIPNLVLADPELTVDLPFHITAATGIDALTHNIEAFLAKNFHPICDGIALEGIRLVSQHLEKACYEPNHIEARKNMLLASMMGAIAFQKGLGVTHSCAHALSTHFDTHHGLANAIMLSACMEFNGHTHADRLARINEALGIEKSTEQAVPVFIKWFEKLKQSLKIPKKLSQAGSIQITEQLIQTAYADPCHANNPRACSLEDFATLYQKSETGYEL